jgi:hypothetical protein
VSEWVSGEVQGARSKKSTKGKVSTSSLTYCGVIRELDFYPTDHFNRRHLQAN